MLETERITFSNVCCEWQHSLVIPIKFSTGCVDNRFIARSCMESSDNAAAIPQTVVIHLVTFSMLAHVYAFVPFVCFNVIRLLFPWMDL